jgi:hypothetical protein
MAGMEKTTKLSRALTAIAGILLFLVAYAVTYFFVTKHETITMNSQEYRFNIFDKKWQAILFFPATRTESFLTRKRIQSSWTHQKKEPFEPLD